MTETRKLAAILVADVVGYSRLDGADEDRTLSHLRGLRSDLIDPAIAAHRGRIVKRTGDGTMIEFRSVVDAVAHQVAVALLDDVAQVDADAALDASVRRNAGVALDQALLHFDRTAHGVNHAAELDDAAVANALDDASVVHGDDRVDEVTAERPEPCQRAVFVRPCEPAVAGDVGHQNRCELAGLGHRAPFTGSK
jgi:adenylate cyclase